MRLGIISDVLGDRKLRLVHVPQPKDLLERVIKEAALAAQSGSIRLEWQPSRERAEYFRLVAQIPVTEITFDQLFNGRSGYRAQYYLSPEEGVLYNRDIINGLVSVLESANRQTPLQVEFNRIETSLRAPHSKIWIFNEREAFDEAVADLLSPLRWVAHRATTGRKAPLPDHCMIDVKGAFIRPDTGDLFVDELKLDRACDLFMKGFT
jgi:hypothetical protein